MDKNKTLAVGSFKIKTGDLIRHAIVLLGAFTMIYPLAWMMVSSFKSELDIFSGDFWAETYTLNNYIQGWAGVSKVTFATFYKNTLTLVIFNIIGLVISSLITAFAFSRLSFKFKKFWFGVMLVTMMLPSQVTQIPQYIMFSELGWIDTFLPLTIPEFFASDGFYIFLMIQFMRGIPRELDQSAKVDGCNTWQIFTHILLPLSLPAIITTVIFTFIGTWNNFLSQLLYLNNVKNFTVSLGLRMFLDAYGQSSYGALFAMSTVSLVPIFIMFLFCQKYLVEGMTAGGIKG